MRIISACSTKKATSDAVKSCISQLTDAGLNQPSWLCVYHTDDYSSDQVAELIVSQYGPIPIHGGTSCRGVMSADGFCSEEGRGIGLLVISDASGDYGVGAVDIDGQPSAAASKAVEIALANAERDGEVPSMVWMNAAPGNEEALIRGIEDVLGPHVPIAGGSSADNSVSGKWRQFTGCDVFNDAVVISVFFPSVKMHYAFHSGYDPTDIKATVTKAEGRTLYEIDGEPAARVYNRWTQGRIQDHLSQGGNVLSETTLSPIGRQVGSVGGIPYYKLSHPYEVTTEGALTLFADIAEGDEVVLMSGSRQSLITRAGRVTQSAISQAGFEPKSIIGALVIYCAGCMLSVQDDMNQVARQIDDAVTNAPFLGIFTFGEQGCFIGNENSHGNLMISAVVFSNEPDF